MPQCMEEAAGPSVGTNGGPGESEVWVGSPSSCKVPLPSHLQSFPFLCTPQVPSPKSLLGVALMRKDAHELSPSILVKGLSEEDHLT